MLNVALILAACLVFYKLLLRRETFYAVNRYVLIVCLAIAFALPLAKVPQQFSLRNSATISQNSGQSPAVKQNIIVSPVVETPVIEKKSASEIRNPQVSSGFSFAQIIKWLAWLYWFGAAVFAASFIFQVCLLVWRSYHNPVIVDGKYRIVEVNGDKAPCSFGNTIFINPEKYEWETYSQILLHEKIHIRQRHTIDILIGEVVLIFQWFNPFAWTYRREIESNLEFLTDDQLMLKEKLDKKIYQLSLVKVSAPHFPLSLTTNYNQSILKKRIAMMNSKRSSLHTAWKYFFLMPVLIFLACLLNEPTAKSQTNDSKHAKNFHNRDIETEGSWFATIKNEKISIQFKSDDDSDGDHGFNNETFKLSDLSPQPKDGQISFKVTRDAGTVEFNGRFEGNTGMGHYKFVADKRYGDDLSGELKEKLDERDQMVFFFVNVKKDFVTMLKGEGFTDITKDEVIPVAALGIDQPYIRSIKNAGFKDLSLERLIPLKALGIDGKYIEEIRSAGYKDISADQLVSFKAQGIDKEYITKVRQMKGKDDKGQGGDAEDIVTFKSMDITPEYVNSFKAVGYDNIPNQELVSFKAVGVTPEYIKGWQALGFKDISPEELVGMKSQNITPDYLKDFTDLGYKDIHPENLVALKALKVTPEWIHSFEAAGYKNIDMDQLPALKSQNITPEYIKSFEAVGFSNIPLEEIVSVKAMGITPEYIKDMKAKGFNYNSLQKYITLKSLD
jgi:beta-lactamase regulating signal transducer with metallopeptidase domain